MKKSLLESYGLAVCFFTVVCFVIVLGMTLWDGVKLTAPGFTLNSRDWKRHQSDEAFKEYLISEHRYGSEKETYTPPEGAALSQAREQSFAQESQSEKRDGFQDLVRNLIILLINLGVFLAHWRIAARARRNVAPESV